MWELYRTQPSFVLGFHGCDEEIGRAAIEGGHHLVQSTNKYDWLGNGIYFWEGSPQRAQEWADSVHSRRPEVVKKPFVVGAVIDLGVCCNLLDVYAAQEMRAAYDALKALSDHQGISLPENKGGSRERPLRFLDRAVIEFMHQARETPAPGNGEQPRPYDTMRAPFLEGDDLFPGAGIRSMNHVQIAVRQVGCIKGYFLPIRSA
jgi:hypothetical protein